ncbi:phosphoglycerate dehydrogenase [Cryptococcus wingfieldii CBS 7118]|uniref:Phosphoglycerate dehydrogenase n=1 Tax=Cryptococcus wingfieldii CBS 7118 TaxID=1295528 RepID=A0A1E3HVI5_9TREE|nr:phosphoglycerate dehydrogenase [Cryptococcus wingfieldii CBS 7118]ODN80329.1 phosphoglycerate dehydrogenase [Cryptococcus wingfieldii CBS 7118]
MATHLPTPPAEPLVRAAQATVYLHTPFHPASEAYAATRFARLLRPSDGPWEVLMPQIDAILLRTGNVTSDMVKAAPKCRIISRNGTGVDNVPIQTCLSQSIAVTNVPGGNAKVVAELALTLMLTVLRRVLEVDRRIRSGECVPSIKALSPGLFGKVVGLVGMGDISYEVGKLVLAFGCQLVVFSPTSPPTRWTSSSSDARSQNQTPLPHTRASSLEDLLRQVDVVSLHCPLNDSTRNLIGEKELGWMKDTAVVINTARGGIVDERALERALKAKKLGGAGLDVFVVEPAYGESLGGLRELDNVVLLPHLGGSTDSITLDGCNTAIDIMADYLDGKGAINRVV